MNNNQRKILAVVEFILRNITAIGAVVYATYVFIKFQNSNAVIDIGEILVSILSILSIIAVSELVERYLKMREIEETTKSTHSLLKNKILERPSAVSFFERPESLEEDIHAYLTTSLNIDLCGLTLTNTINKELSAIRAQLKQGARIRILIADPESQAVEMSTLRSEDSKDFIYFRGRLDSTMRDVEFLYRDWVSWKSQNPKETNLGDFMVRFIPYAPSFGIKSFDGTEKDGNIIVEIYSHKKGYSSPPVFSLNYLRDGRWYEYFQSQFEQMWEDAKDWKPSRVRSGK